MCVMWQMSTHANAMLFCYEISLLKFYALLSWNLYCSDLGTLCVKKKISKNCISGEKITNMRSAPFWQCQYFHWNCYSNPSFTDTKRFFNETKFSDTVYRYSHMFIFLSIGISISISFSISSSAHLLIVSISISVSSSSSAHLLICSSAHMLICS